MKWKLYLQTVTLSTTVHEIQCIGLGSIYLMHKFMQRKKQYICISDPYY